MTGAVAAMGGVRTPTLAISDMATLGGAGPRTLSLSSTFAVSASGNYIFPIDVIDGAGTVEDFWLTNGAPANYEARVTVLSGSLVSGTTGSWVRLDSAQSWVSNAHASLTLEIGAYGTSSALDSCTVTL